MNELMMREEDEIRRSKSMFLHPPPDIEIKIIKQIGDYTLGAELGSGAFGKVVLGKHILTNELVAIKILDKMILNQIPEDYESVKQEIAILKSVKHKNIVQLYEILETSRHIFIIMEYCEGKDIMDYILTKNRLSEEESLKYFQQLINALFYLHSQNIAHRDIKIDNMLLDRNRDLKLVDFGLSTKYPDDNLLEQPCGTVVYAAPEVLQGKEYHGMLADVWSSGIVLFGMLSGYLPFGDQDDDANKLKIISGKVTYPSYFSPLAIDLLSHMLDLDPMTRYTLQEIRSHPWFNSKDYRLIPGIIIGFNLIPVDEKILNLCVTYNYDKEKVRESVINNKFNPETVLYYLLIKKLGRKGFHSVSDLSSDEFINFILDDNNLVHQIKEDMINNNEMHSHSHDDNRERNNISDDNKENIEQRIITLSSEQNENEHEDSRRSRREINRENSHKELITISQNENEDNLGPPPGLLSNIISTPSVKLFKNEDIYPEISDYLISHSSSERKKRDDKIDLHKNKINEEKIIKEINVNKEEKNVKENQEINEIKIIKEIKETNNNQNENLVNKDNNQIIGGHNEIKQNNIIKKKIDISNDSSLIMNDNKENYSNNIIETPNNHSNMGKANKLSNIIETPVNESKNNYIKIDNQFKLIDTPLEKKDFNNKNNILDRLDQNISIENEKIKAHLCSIETPIDNYLSRTSEVGKNKNNTNNVNNNTLSKQKVYIERTKDYSNKNKNTDTKMNLDKFKDIRKINLFQKESLLDNSGKKLVINDTKENGQNSEQKDENINERIIEKPNFNIEEIKEIKDKIDDTLTNRNDGNINKEIDTNEIIINIEKKNENIEKIQKENISDNIEKKENIEKEIDDSKIIEYQGKEKVKEYQGKEESSLNNHEKSKEDPSLNKSEKEKEVSSLNKSEKEIKITYEGGNLKEDKIIIVDNNDKEIKGNVDMKQKEENKGQDLQQANIVNKKEININGKKKYSKNMANQINKNKTNKTSIQKNNKIKTVKKDPVLSSLMKNNNIIVVPKNILKQGIEMTSNSIERINKKKNNPTEIKIIKVSPINKKKVSKEKGTITVKKKEKKNYSSIEKNVKPKLNEKKKNPETEIIENKKIKMFRINKNNKSTFYNKYTSTKNKLNNKNSIVLSKDNKSFSKNSIHNSNKGFFRNNCIQSCSQPSIAADENNKKPKTTYRNSNYESIFKNRKSINQKNKITPNKIIFTISKFYTNKITNSKIAKSIIKYTNEKNNNISSKIYQTNLNIKFNEIAHTTNNKKSQNHCFEKNKTSLWNHLHGQTVENTNRAKSKSSNTDIDIMNINMNKSNQKNVKGNQYYQLKTEEKNTTNQNIFGKNNKVIIKQNEKKNESKLFYTDNKMNKMKKSSSLSKYKNTVLQKIRDCILYKNYLKNKKSNHLESSVGTQRYKSPYGVRELSESVKNKYLNEKTRNSQLPWNLKKKGIDEKISLNIIYHKYMNKCNKNPFKFNNKKIIIKKNNNNIKKKQKNEQNNNKIIDQHFEFKNSLKEILSNKPNINIEKSNHIALTTIKKNDYNENNNYCQWSKNNVQKNSISSIQKISVNNINPNKLFVNTNNIKNSINSNSLIRSISLNKNEPNKNKLMIDNNNNFFIFDLSCVFILNNNDCYSNLINKLQKNNIFFIKKKNNVFRCGKYGSYCDIEIVKLEEDGNIKDEKKKRNVYCYKIIRQRGNNSISKYFTKLLLNSK